MHHSLLLSKQITDVINEFESELKEEKFATFKENIVLSRMKLKIVVIVMNDELKTTECLTKIDEFLAQEV